MSAAWKSRFRKDHPPRFLQNEVRETPSISVCRVRKDVLFDERHALLRLQHRRATFDVVIALRVEGVSISGISRVEGIAWNTVARWLERAAQVCRRFNDETVTGFAVEELQADEIRTFVGAKTQPTWIFAAIEVWSRLWPSTVVGRRSYRNTLVLIRDVWSRMDFLRFPLIVTDGFDFYAKVVRRVFGPACLYGRVLKTRRNDRIVKVERRELVGAAWRFEEALNNSEDSSTLNTSFIERLNLTIRQGSAYLRRRSPMPRALEGDARRASGVAALLLQLRQTAQGSEVRARSPNSSHASETDHEAALVSRHLLGEDDSFVVARRDVPAYWGAQPSLFRQRATAGSRLATLDDGSTPRSIWRSADSSLTWPSASAAGSFSLESCERAGFETAGMGMSYAFTKTPIQRSPRPPVFSALHWSSRRSVASASYLAPPSIWPTRERCPATSRVLRCSSDWCVSRSLTSLVFSSLGCSGQARPTPRLQFWRAETTMRSRPSNGSSIPDGLPTGDGRSSTTRSSTPSATTSAIVGLSTSSRPTRTASATAFRRAADLQRILARLRRITLALPEAEETTSFGHPTFKVGKKTCAVLEEYKGKLPICFFMFQRELLGGHPNQPVSFRAAREVEDFGMYRANDGEKQGDAGMDCLEVRPLSFAVPALVAKAQGGSAGGHSLTSSK